MVSLNCFTTLKLSFFKKKRSILVEIDFATSKNYFTQQILSDLEALFNWSPHHLEIATIILSSNSTSFGRGLSPIAWAKSSNEEINHFLKRLQQLIYSAFFLPQTIIIDLKKGTENLSAELSLAADLRVADQTATIQFNHLMQGMTPCSGGIGFLSALIPKTSARNWVLGGRAISAEELKAIGFLYQCYEEEKREVSLHQILEEIAEQAPIQRIQAKRAFLETILKDIELSQQFETAIGRAAYFSEDWREYLLAQIENHPAQFTSPQFLIQKLKTNATHHPTV